MTEEEYYEGVIYSKDTDGVYYPSFEDINSRIDILSDLLESSNFKILDSNKILDIDLSNLEYELNLLKEDIESESVGLDEANLEICRLEEDIKYFLDEVKDSYEIAVDESDLY